jgi:hypothetical protein
MRSAIEDSVLDPAAIVPGLRVVIYETSEPGVRKLARFPYRIVCTQGPFVALESLNRAEFRCLVDTRNTKLLELSAEMRAALEDVVES